MSSRGLILLVYMTLLMAVVSVLALPALRAEAVDPTRPPLLQTPRSAPVAAPRIDPTDYPVSSILVSEHRKVAVINNQVVSVGDTVNSAKGERATVIVINASEITLSRASREFVVRLPSSQYRISAVQATEQPQMKDQP